MNLIQSISSTLKTWVFKKKLLKFSGRFRQEPEACFYCPEMCRFSCPVAETLKDNSVTPRGKMSLVHLAERGFSDEKVAGGAEERLWFLEQCTGCGRCTEFCLYENDVGSILREERAKHNEKSQVSNFVNYEGILSELRTLRGSVLFCEPGRKSWWESHPELVQSLGVSVISEISIPHKQWSWGKLTASDLVSIGESLSGCTRIWAESPELGWFLEKGLKSETRKFKSDVKVVWQNFFRDFAAKDLPPSVSFHESYHLSRLLPRLGISVPMYERGLMPFHSGWNVYDCGGEGHYPLSQPEHANEMGKRFLQDLRQDGRALEKIICQNLACVEHLKSVENVTVVYWLDELANGK